MTLEEEYIVFTSQFGEAIAAWSLVEHSLMEMLTSCFNRDGKNLDALRIGLLSLDGFRAKLDFVDGVASTTLPYEHGEDWVALVERARALSGTRNRIAHWSVGLYEHASPGRRLVLQSLVSTEAEVKRKRRGPPRPPSSAVGVNELLRIMEDFLALHYALTNFSARVRGQPEPHPRSAEQASHRTTVQTRVRLIHEELGHPQQSSREKERQRDAANAAASWRIPVAGKDGNETEGK